MGDEVVKKEQNGTLDTAKRVRFGPQVSALHQRVASNATKTQERELETASMPNRIGMLLDDSGSMCGDPIELARQAAQGFLDACDPNTTAVAVRTLNQTLTIPLTRQFPLAASECRMLKATGGTPLGYRMESQLQDESMTRAIIVSDGEPDSAQACFDSALHYKEAGIPVDCVHIGSSSGGENTLAEIARITGGIYIKFSQIENFAENFKFLSPRYRAMLEDRAAAARLLGAREVK